MVLFYGNHRTKSVEPQPATMMVISYFTLRLSVFSFALSRMLQHYQVILIKVGKLERRQRWLFVLPLLCRLWLLVFTKYPALQKCERHIQIPIRMDAPNLKNHNFDKEGNVNSRSGNVQTLPQQLSQFSKWS